MRRWEALATEHLPWLAHLSRKYGVPAARLLRELRPDDLALEIAIVIHDTAQQIATRLIDRPDADTAAEVARIRHGRDVLSRATQLYLTRIQAERDAAAARAMDAELERIMRAQEALSP